MQNLIQENIEKKYEPKYFNLFNDNDFDNLPHEDLEKVLSKLKFLSKNFNSQTNQNSEEVSKTLNQLGIDQNSEDPFSITRKLLILIDKLDLKLKKN